MVVQGNKLLKTKIPALRQSLAVYLANEETEHILFRPVKVHILINMHHTKCSVTLSCLERVWDQDYNM